MEVTLIATDRFALFNLSRVFPTNDINGFSYDRAAVVERVGYWFTPSGADGGFPSAVCPSAVPCS